MYSFACRRTLNLSLFSFSRFNHTCMPCKQCAVFEHLLLAKSRFLNVCPHAHAQIYQYTCSNTLSRCGGDLFEELRPDFPFSYLAPEASRLVQEVCCLCLYLSLWACNQKSCVLGRECTHAHFCTCTHRVFCSSADSASILSLDLARVINLANHNPRRW